MCQLLGMNCNVPTDITFSFSGFSRRGGVTGDHTDGWGIGFFEAGEPGVDGAPADDRGLRLFVDHQSAHASPVAELIRRYPIRSRHVVAHIRKATQGRVALHNCHPFVRELWGRYWVFAHNGDLKDHRPRLHPGAHGTFRPVGDTDSEWAFCWLMQELAKSHADNPGIDELSRTLAELLPQLAAHGTFNMLLSNGQALWAHASTALWHIERAHPFGRATLADDDLSVDFAQATRPDDRVAVVVTAPLTTDERWHAFAPGELRVFVDGRLHRAARCR